VGTITVHQVCLRAESAGFDGRPVRGRDEGIVIVLDERTIQ
jgi:hypothetical protein